MTEQEYMDEVLRTYAGSNDPLDKLTLAALGVTGESGEVADTVKKVLYQGHTLDTTHLKQELGDVLWYVTLACNAIGCTLEDVMRGNVAKLHTRYPDGFDAQRSITRSQEETIR